MRTTSPNLLWLPAVALLLILGATAPAARADEISLHIIATDGENRYWFQVEGYPGENPTLSFAPGDKVTVRVSNAGTQPHNVHFGSPIAKGSEYLMPGASETFTFTVPGGIDARQIGYWCDPHRQIGMVGAVTLGATMGEQEVETPQRETAAPGLAPLLLAVALVLAARGRRAS